MRNERDLLNILVSTGQTPRAANHSIGRHRIGYVVIGYNRFKTIASGNVGN